MAVTLLGTTPRIKENIGQVAFRRGPLVYCLEKTGADSFDLERIAVAVEPESVCESVQVEWNPDLLGGVNALRVPAIERAPTEKPYFDLSRTGRSRQIEVSLIPFYARANRSEESQWLTLLPVAAPGF
jgi:DUF1680 family protein